MGYRADKLQAQIWVKIDFKVKFDIEGQGRLPPKTRGTLTKMFGIHCPNLVILAWTCPGFLRGKSVIDTYTGIRAHRR